MHVSAGGQRIWNDLQFNDYADGFEVPVEVEEDEDGPAVRVTQYYVPFPYVVIDRKPVSRRQRDCKKCRGLGAVYDLYAAERIVCPGCQSPSR